MKVVLGVTGCIGAYKSALILRLLQKENLEVQPVLTRNAARFIGALTLESLSGKRALVGMFRPGRGKIDHIAEARESDLLLVAPATANILAKFAAGIADDFLSTLYLSTTTPVAVAPAMNVAMWHHPATQHNLKVLRERGVQVIEPASGYQACGEYGEGRLAEPEVIVRRVLEILRRGKSLTGVEILVTAGPTVEDIDGVRFISNRSSGKMGYAVAAEANRRGATVRLVTGPVWLPVPPCAEVVRVRSAAEMKQAVLERFPKSQVVIKAAAVADYRPAEALKGKTKKSGRSWMLELVPTEDILKSLGERKKDQILVGFAAETSNLREEARRKLREKNLDLVVANDVSSSDSGFEVDFNQVLLVDREGGESELPRLRKEELAVHICDRIAALLTDRRSPVALPV